jgi:hypothetical protein
MTLYHNSLSQSNILPFPLYENAAACPALKAGRFKLFRNIQKKVKTKLLGSGTGDWEWLANG